MQNHYNLVYREEEREMIPFCRRRGHRRHSVEPAGARLPGRQPQARRARRRRCASSTTPTATRLYYTDADYDVADRVVEVATQKGVLPIQVALAWILSKPGVTAPIVSATKLEQLDQLIDGMSMTLTPDEIAALEEPYVPHTVIGIV